MTLNASLEREFKKQKFLEKIESVLDLDDEKEFVEFIRDLMAKKGYAFFTKEMMKRMIDEIKQKAINELDYLKHNTIIAKNRNIDRNKLNDDEGMKDLVEVLLKEIYLDLVNSKKYRIDVIENYASAVVSVSVIVVDPKKPSQSEEYPGNNQV